MTTRSPAIARGCLEGLAGGAAAGAFLLALERSPTFHVYADVLNAIFRMLAGRLDETTLVRADTEAVAFAAYVGGHALFGALIGMGLGATFFRGRPTGRVLALGAVIAAVDAFVFGAVWWHRSLPTVIGAGIVVFAGVGAAAVAATTGRVLDRAFGRRALAVLAWVAFVATGGTSLGTVVSASRARPSPDGPVVQDATRTDTGVKVAILGLDGLDWFLVEEAFEAGRLPNLKKLVENGTRGDLRSIRPPKSPVVWTSIATGMLPSVHGIRHFVVPREGHNVPVTSNLREVPALWNIAETARFTVAFVNWYVTWPAEPVPGLMISDRADFTGLDHRVYPEALTATVDSIRATVDLRPDRGIARFTRVGGDFDQWRTGHWGQVRRALDILDDVVRHDLVTLETARLALRHEQPSLTALYFRGTDNTQHLFWKYRLALSRDSGVAGWLYDDLRPGDAKLLGAVIERYYDFIDELVGETIAMLEPDTAILVLSDHGFLTNNERSRWYHPNRLLAAAGLCVLQSSEGGVADSAASVVLDPGPPTISPVRVLRPGGAAENPTDALVRARVALGKLHLDSGAPVFEALSMERDSTGPLLRVTFAPTLDGASAFLDATEIPLSEFTVPEGHSGDHRMNGTLIASGGPFRRGARLDGARAVDVAPTVLHLLGAPAALDMEGVVLTDLMEPTWREAHPVSYVASYGRRKSSGEAIATDADDAIRRELEALGYITR